MMAYKFINAFQPSQKEKEEHKQAEKEFAYKCWMPESVIPVGDTTIYFNNIEDIEKLDLPKSMINYIKSYYQKTSGN